MKAIKNFILENNNGEKFKLTDFQKNKNLLLIFFRGAWCQHCKKQLADVQRYLKKIQTASFCVMAVSNDDKLKSSLLKSFLKLNFPVIADEKMELIKYFNIKTKYKNKIVAKPSIFMIDKRQKLLYSYVGKKYDDRLSAKNIIKTINEL
ncbi:redoxin domain-containing protein [Candidatus Falkowbacteria bacterium]|nr:redoxin domain-containing protein [Candidatus Falkowbacteria bacterium]